VWHAGISGSIPLKMASDVNELVKDTNGVITSVIPIGNTILDWHNIIMVVIVTIALVVINSLMHPKTGIVAIDPALLQEDAVETHENASQKTPAMKLENSRLLSALLALLGLSFLIISLFFKHKAFDLGSVILLFLFLGIVLHKTPIAYVRAFAKSVGGAAGILLQFPFYAGIMGIITGVGESGICLGTVVSEAFVNISTSTTYPIYTFLCAAILNMFVPSGGGHWAIQAPIMFAAGEALNVDHGLTGMAIAWGDAWTNLIQPFWALPALAIAKLNAKDIMGFCLIDLVVSGIIIISGLLIWAI
jgi:short-chain fatty acids transporter